MKKLFSILLVMLFVISMFSTVAFATEEENEDSLYLATIQAESATGFITPIFDIEGTIRHAEGDLKFPHSIEAHPISPDEASYIIYNIEEYDYTHFSAYLGKNADLAAAGMHVVFVVWADDEVIFESEPVAIGDEPVGCVAKIPEGTKKLMLEVNAGSDTQSYDTSTWGTPMLSNISITELKESRKVSKTQYFIGDEFAPSGGFYAIKYSNEMEVVGMLDASMVTGFDSTTAGTKTLTVTYEGKSYTFDITVSEKATPTPKPEATVTPKKTSEGGSSSEGGDNTIFIIIGIVAAVIVIAVVAVIVMNKKKKNA